MNILRVRHYLTDTVNGVEHARAVEMKTVLDALAREKDAEVTLFEVVDGEVTVGVSNEEALKHIEDSLKSLDGVEVRVLSMLQAQLERNRAAQASIDKKRETKKNNKEAKEKAKS